MVGTIGPVVHGAKAGAPGRRYPMMVFNLASFTAAGAVGAAMGALGQMSLEGLAGTGTVIWITAAVAGLAAITDAGLVRMPFPNTRRQVSRAWSRRYGPCTAALMYGAGLGVGIATHVELLLFYALPVWAFLSGSVAESAIVYSVFGLARGLAIASVRVRGADGNVIEARLQDLALVERVARFGGALVGAAATAAMVTAVV